MATPADVQQLVRNIDKLFCSKHGETIRATLPNAYTPFALEMLRTLLGYSVFLEECELLAPEGQAPTVVEIARALGHRPCCCRLTSEDLEQAYADSGVGIEGTCSGCGREDERGIPFQIRNFWGRVRRIEHRCFRCCAAGAEPPGGA